MDRSNERRFPKLSAEEKKVILKAFKETMPDLKLAKPQAQSTVSKQKQSNPTKPSVDNRPYPRLTEGQKERLGKTFQNSQQTGRDLTKD